MRRAILFALLATGLASGPAPVRADHWGHSYPKVRTFSGGYYGPTQAHYQYQRRYGRPWHGHGGLHGGFGIGAVNGYPGYYGGYGAVLGGWAFPSYSSFAYVSPFGYGSYYSSFGTYAPLWGGGLGFPPGWGGYTSAIPYVPGFDLTSPQPDFINSTGSMNPVLSDAWDENLKQWEQPLELQPIIPSGRPALPASTPEARLRSLRLQEQGDRRLHESDYLLASRRYREAISAAPDRAEPHLHLAMALAGMKQFNEAVKELKVGLALDPSWPASGISLDALLGPDNIITKTQIKQRIAEWTLEDVRDPDRLFLLSAMLYLDNDPVRGRQIMETAARLSGMHEHLAAFLRQGDAGIAVGTVESPDVDGIAEPRPDAPSAEVPELPPLPIPPKETAPPDSAPPRNDEATPGDNEPSPAPAPAAQLNGPVLLPNGVHQSSPGSSSTGEI